MNRWTNLPLILAIGLVGCGDGGGNNPASSGGGKNEIVTVSTSVGHTLQISERLLENTKILFTGESNTYIMNPDGSNRIMLTDRYFDRMYWSPDGRKIVMYDLPAIYVMNPDGSDLKELARGRIRTPPWSPDGTKILFSDDVTDTLYITLINVDGSGKQQLVQGFNSSWSPDKKKIVFTRRVEGEDQKIEPYIYTANVDGSNVKQLTKGLRAFWSPDGTHIAFYNCDSGDCYDQYDIYVIDPEGSSKKKIGSGYLEDYSLAWSPDGKKIAFIGEDGEHSDDIFIANLNGIGEPLAITNYADINSLSWSPDGSKIVFESGDEDEDSVEIGMINPNGTNRVTIVKDATNPNPVWSPFIPKGVFIE